MEVEKWCGRDSRYEMGGHGLLGGVEHCKRRWHVDCKGKLITNNTMKIFPFIYLFRLTLPVPIIRLRSLSAEKQE